jgi:hypothetical protein
MLGTFTATLLDLQRKAAPPGIIVAVALRGS